MFALSNLALALIVAIAYRLHLNTATVGLLCLSVIVLHALADGFVSSAIVSIIAGACLAYFFAYPIFDFRIYDPVDLTAFLIFLIVSNALAGLVSMGYRTLRDGRRHLALAESAAHVAVWECDLRTKVTTFSGEYNKLYGLAAGKRSLTYDEWLGLIHPEDREAVRAHVHDTLTRTYIWDEEFRVIWPDGSIHWLLGRGTVFQDETGQAVRMGGVNMDVTERKYTAEALRQSEERCRLAVQATNDAVWDIDLMTGTVSWNDTYATLYGRPPESSESWQWWIDRIHPEDRERASGGLSSAISGRESTWNCEYRFQRADGAWAYIHDRAYIARDPSGSAWRVIGAMQDLTQRKRAEAELRESEERFRRLFEDGPLGVGLVGKNYRFEKVNGALCQMVGYSEAELLQRSFADITHPDDLQADVELAERLFTGEIPFYKLRKRYVKKNGEIIWIDLTGSVIRDREGEVMYGLAMIEDITEVKRTQEEALAGQKLESLGVLAGGIAHDFNNLLGGIHSVAELVEMDLAVSSAAREEIQRIKMAAIRGSEIVRELMIYAGETHKDLNEAVDVSRLVEEMLRLLKVSISKQVALRTDFRGNLPTVWGNAPQIRQVVMNLVLNASEAIGDSQGVITVTTAQVSGGSDLAPNNMTDLTAGDYVRIEISDTGCGMTEETKAKIFDPFFSTKFPGRGLGLAVVQGIVRGLGGAINIVSTPGQGTAFQVLLPCAPKGASEIHSTITTGGLEKSNANARTILVVEDDQTLRRAVSKGLQKRGFLVIEASDGSVALDLIHAHRDEIDVVLLDITLPGASSREVFEELLRIRPDLNVIVTSAYDERMVDTYYAGLRVNHFIRKPFRLDDLVRLTGTALPARAR